MILPYYFSYSTESCFMLSYRSYFRHFKNSSQIMIFNKLELVAKISIDSVLINIVISAALFKSLMEYLFRLQQQNEVVILSTI